MRSFIERISCLSREWASTEKNQAKPDSVAFCGQLVERYLRFAVFVSSFRIIRNFRIAAEINDPQIV